MFPKFFWCPWKNLSILIVLLQKSNFANFHLLHFNPKIGFKQCLLFKMQNSEKMHVSSEVVANYCVKTIRSCNVHAVANAKHFKKWQ